MPSRSFSRPAMLIRLCSMRSRIAFLVAAARSLRPARWPVILRTRSAASSSLSGLAALVDVDELRLALRRLVAHDEVPRQADADHLQVQPPRQLHVQHRQRDRHALAVVDHLVEIAVGAGVVVVPAAVEAALLEQEAVERVEASVAASASLGSSSATVAGQAVDLAAVGLDVQLLVVELGDQQGGVRAGRSWRPRPCDRLGQLVRACAA